MKITVEFDNLKEIEDFCNGVVIAPGLARACRKENAEAATEAKEAPKAKKSTPKKAEAQEEAPAQSDEAPEKDEAPADDISESDLKILLSKKLKAGKKAKVKELFEGYGVDSLSGLIEKHPDKIAEAYHKAEGI